MEQRNAQEIQPRSVKFSLQLRYWGRNMDLFRMSPKVNNNPLFGYFKMNRNQQKLFHAVLPMIACFFGYTGHVTTVALEDRKTVNTDWYTTICLPEIINELRRTNRNRRIILYHDNASCHTARQIVDFLSSNNVELMTHCPYSLDLSPNDFFLFPNIKNKMCGERFESPKAAVETFRTLIFEVTARVEKMLRKLVRAYAKMYRS